MPAKGTKGLVFFIFFSLLLFSAHFPVLSLESSHGLTPSSTSFFLGSVTLLAPRLPRGERGHLGPRLESEQTNVLGWCSVFPGTLFLF